MLRVLNGLERTNQPEEVIARLKDRVIFALAGTLQSATNAQAITWAGIFLKSVGSS